MKKEKEKEKDNRVKEGEDLWNGSNQGRSIKINIGDYLLMDTSKIPIDSQTVVIV